MDQIPTMIQTYFVLQALQKETTNVAHCEDSESRRKWETSYTLDKNSLSILL